MFPRSQIFGGIERLITNSGVFDKGGDQDHESLEGATISITHCSFARGFWSLTHTDGIGFVKEKADISLLYPDRGTILSSKGIEANRERLWIIGFLGRSGKV
jgi:hypothetical protein